MSYYVMVCEGKYPVMPIARGPDFVRQVSEWLADPQKLDTGYGLELKSFIELPEDGALWLSIERGSPAEDLLFRKVVHRNCSIVGRLAYRDRAGLVEHQRVDLA